MSYAVPASLDEALACLAAHGRDSVVLAGGMSVVPALKKGLLAGKWLVNIKGIDDPSLRMVDAAEDRLRIGALVRHRDLETSALVAARLPVLRDLEQTLASVQIRNHGTLAGNLCAAEPWSDPPCLLAALDARLVVASRRGAREVSAVDWICAGTTTLRQPDELLVRIDVPLPGSAEGVGYARIAPRQGLARPLACAASHITLAENGTIAAARIFVGAIGPRPQRMASIEAVLLGEKLSPEASAAIDDAVLRSVYHIPDERCGVTYKQQVAGVLVRRAVAAAIANAQTLRGGE